MELSQIILTGAGSVLVTVIAGWKLIQWRVGKLEELLVANEAKSSERYEKSKVSKHRVLRALEESTKEEIKRVEKVANDRVDKTQEKLEKHIDNTRNEIKTVTQAIHDSEKRIIQEIHNKR